MASQASANILDINTPIAIGGGNLTPTVDSGAATLTATDAETGVEVSFDVVLTVSAADNSGPANVNANGSNDLGVMGNGSGGISGGGETLTYTVSSVSNVTAGFTVTFDGFTGIQLRLADAATDAGAVNGVAFGQQASATERFDLAGSPDSIVVAHTGGVFRAGDAFGGFTATAIPEPASAALVALIGRRRKTKG